MARRVHLIAKSKGFWDDEVTYDKIGNKLALVHSEVTEVLEAIRKSQGSEKVVEEIADIVIRILDVYAVRPIALNNAATTEIPRLILMSIPS